MAKESQSEITFPNLREYLCRIGFDQPARVEHSLAFHHPDSGTIVMLSVPKDGKTVRPADLLSIAMRLEHQGLVDDADLEVFRSGKLPAAS